MISVVIPAYNEAKRIGRVIEKAKLYAEEVLVINDASLDQTTQVAREAGVRVMNKKEKKGYIDSIKTGFLEAKGDIVVTMDADGEHNPEEISLLTQPISDGRADIVIGKRGKIPRISERVISWLTSIKTGVEDSGSGFRAMKKDMALNLNLSGKCICGLSVLEAYYLGARITEVPITINSIDKRRKIAWEHLFQFFHLLGWMIKAEVKGEYVRNRRKT